ncbi:MAG: MFS transporter [Rhodospirillaceae bacterium]
MIAKRRTTLATCCSAHSVQDGMTDLLYVLLPILADAFGLNYSQVGALRAANRSAMAVFEMPSGFLSERMGERALLVFGLVAVGLGYFLLAGAASFETVFACLVLAGLGAAFQHTLSSALVSRVFLDGPRRAALGTYNASGDVGKLTFAGVFTLLLGLGFHWRDMVTGFGVLAILSAVLLFWTLNAANAGGPPEKLLAHKKKDAAGKLGWGILDKPAFTSLGVIIFLDISVQGGFLTFLAFLMIEKQVPTSLAAFAVVLTLLGGAFGKFGCGFLAEKLGVIRSLFVVEFLTAAGILAVYWLPTLPGYFLLPVLGIFLQGSSTVTYGTIGDLFHKDRQARGFAIVYTIAGAAIVAGPIGFGIISDLCGLGTAMIAMAVVTATPIVLCVPLTRGLANLAQPASLEQTA